MRYIFLILLAGIFSIAKPAQTDTVVVGCDYNYPPYSFTNENNQLVGYDIDVIHSLSRISGIHFIIIPGKWDSLLLELDQGKIDALAGIVYDDSREKKFDFTFPLRTVYYEIFARKEIYIKQIDDLTKYRVALLMGDIASIRLLKPLGLYNKGIKTVSLPEALMLVENDSCDFVVAPYPLGMNVIKSRGLKNIEVKGDPIISSVYCMAVKEGDAALLARLNDGIQTLIRNGELDRLSKKWIKYSRKEEQEHAYFLWARLAVISLLIISGILFLFWYSLKKQVKKKTRQIKDANELYFKVFNSVDEAMLLFDKDRIIKDANERALRMYGIEYDDLIGRNGKVVFSLEEEATFSEMIKKLKPNQCYIKELVIKNEEGRARYEVVSGMVVETVGETQYLAVIKDITDEKEGIIRLEEAKKVAESANHTKSTFLSTISHEIRTPLNAVIGYAEILDKTELTGKQRDYTNKISMSGELLLGLVNDLLDLTKIEAGKLTLDIQPFNLRKVIDKVIDIERFKANEKGLKLELKIDEHLPDNFYGDELRLSQILLNLINNAIKYTPSGKASLWLHPESDQYNNGWINILFSVRDSGIGIPLENQERLFKPFEQAQSSNARKYGGTGLGLAISKQLVKLMSGEIMVESTVGKGSVFNFSIPLKPCSEQILKESSSHFSASGMLKGVKVLLVEDNAFIAEIEQEQLSRISVKVMHAESGKKAIEMIQLYEFDIILLDIEMPEMDGFETMKRIRAIDRKIPVVALSAHGMETEKSRALAAGMVDYLSKPASLTKLAK